MTRHSLRKQIAIAALAVGTFASVPAFAQSTNGPGGQDYGAGSSPQTGGASYQSAHAQKPLYNAAAQKQHQQLQPTNVSSGPNGPGGANYGAGDGPQTGR